MDSEKKLKLFLEETQDSEGFQQFLVSEVQGQKSALNSNFDAGKDLHLNNEFGFPEQFWGWLQGDAQLRAEFETMMEARAQELAKTIVEKETAAALERGRQEGITLGIQEGLNQVTISKQCLDELCEAVLKEKTAMLHSHEVPWMRALSHLLRRFLISNRQAAAIDLEKWIQEGIATFEHSGRIRLHVAYEDFDRIKNAIGDQEYKGWELVPNSELKSGQVNCECGNGGMFFSPEEELAKLDRIVDRHMPKGT